jgi:hypothetical protein
MSTEKHKYKWTLKWAGHDDTPAFRAAIKHCETFHIWKPYNLRIVSFDEWVGLIENGETEDRRTPELNFWSIKPGQLGMVADSHTASQYQRTWDQLSTCLQDFLRGWHAAEEHIKSLPPPPPIKVPRIKYAIVEPIYVE